MRARHVALSALSGVGVVLAPVTVSSAVGPSSLVPDGWFWPMVGVGALFGGVLGALGGRSGVERIVDLTDRVGRWLPWV